jgi:hypothetical protein
MFLKAIIAFRTTDGNISPRNDSIEDGWEKRPVLRNETMFMREEKLTLYKLNSDLEDDSDYYFLVSLLF